MHVWFAEILHLQFSLVAQSCPTLVTPWITACQASLSITNSSNSHPSIQWCHPAISSSVVPFSSCLQSLPASDSFPMSQLFAGGGQSTGASPLASFLPMNIQDWSPLGWLDLLAVQGTLKSLLQQFKSINSSALSFLHSPALTSIHDHWKNHNLN